MVIGSFCAMQRCAATHVHMQKCSGVDEHERFELRTICGRFVAMLAGFEALAFLDWAIVRLRYNQPALTCSVEFCIIVHSGIVGCQNYPSS